MSFKQKEMQDLVTRFNDASEIVEGVECWSARDLQPLLGYKEYRNLNIAVERAKQACENSGVPVSDHFVEANKLITAGKGAEREVEDTLLTRYGAYLVAQNCDPGKENVALAQSYFSVQTRKQEMIEQRALEIDRLNQRKRVTASEKALSSVCLTHDVKPHEIAVVKSEGDRVFFGGHTTAEMKDKYGVPDNRPLADFLPKVALSGKEFALNLTAHVVTQQQLQGVTEVTDCHRESNQVVRDAALSMGVVFEELPPDEDTRRIERRIKADERTLSITHKG